MGRKHKYIFESEVQIYVSRNWSSTNVVFYPKFAGLFQLYTLCIPVLTCCDCTLLRKARSPFLGRDCVQIPLFSSWQRLVKGAICDAENYATT